MIDSSKLKVIKFIGYILLIILAVFIGVGIGQTVADHNQKKEIAESKQTATKEGLNQEEVKEFLVNYYTKKDLGENRNRYKEYMTDGLYKQTVAKEEEPVSQTYKGFVVDFQFKSAEIYINQDKLQVIAQVNYVNTLLDENGKMKVNKMESIILTDQTGDYGILDSTKPSEGSTTDSSTKPTTTPSTSNSN